MAIVIKGDNNGIAVEGSLKIEHLDFEFGKGIKKIAGVSDTTKEECSFANAEEIVEGEDISYDPLSTDKAMAIWKILRKNHLVDKHNQPHVSQPKAAISRRTRQTLWEECTDANPKLSLNDT